MPNPNGLKVLEFQKPAPKPLPPPTPYQEILLEAYHMADGIRNMAIMAHMHDGTIKVLHAIEPSITLHDFVEWISSRRIAHINDLLSTRGNPQETS